MLDYATERRPVGRPPTGEQRNRSLRLSPEMYTAIALWQQKRIDLACKTTSECIRELLQIALSSEGIIRRGMKL